MPKSPAWSAAALLWAADYFPAQAMLVASGRSAHEYVARTIEHSMWFHCSVDPTAWMHERYRFVVDLLSTTTTARSRPR
jgi:acyl-CoA thioesterase